MIIAILNQKGGVGKTTLSVHIATALAKQGKRLLMVDADPQGSALDWSAMRQDNALFSVIGLPKPSLHKELPSIAKDYDVVLIDSPPRVDEIARSAILASNVVLIPVQPSPFDVWGSNKTVEILNQASAFTENLKTAFVINRKIVNSAIGRDVKEAVANFNLPVLEAAISQRVAFAESVSTGQTVLETDPSGLASQEILVLVKELMEFVQ